MTTETGMNRGGNFTRTVLPWLLGAGMFAVYWLTLQRIAGPLSLERLANLNDWDWNPSVLGPVTCVVIAPLRWLPASIMPVAMNLFSACCAALALVLLARSVALLPHDRTNAQREREQSEYSLLTMRAAWLPPFLAVLVCGLQLTFWENATEFRKSSNGDTGEMINLVLYAAVIWCLLEYRVRRRESWLSWGGLIFGLGMANNWTMVSLLPVFLIAVAWIKGLDFFNWRFLVRLAGLVAVGFSLIIVPPVLSGWHHAQNLGAWQSVGLVLGAEKTQLLHSGIDKKLLLQLALTSFLPVFLIGIRWASSFGDSSPLGIVLANLVFNVIHAFFLLACIWVALDPPFGPRQSVPPHYSFLKLYYLGALGVGYFAGYFLLVFGVRAPKSRRNPLVRWLDRLVTACVWLLAIAAPLALAAKNLPELRERTATADAFANYFRRVGQSLPAGNTVVLSDDSQMLYFLQAALATGENPASRVFIDTAALARSWPYVHFLEKKHSDRHLSDYLQQTEANHEHPLDIDCLRLIQKLSESHAICYLHPSFGYYFELFYPQTHGLAYQLQPYPTNMWLVPPMSGEQIMQNQAFWKDAGNDLDWLTHALEPPKKNFNPNAWEKFRSLALLTSETNKLLPTLGRYYSRALNSWGVELERNGRIGEAGKCFEQAQLLYPDNVAARINLQFNQKLLAGEAPEVKPPKNALDKLGNHLFRVMSDGGPLDEPNICGVLASGFADGLNYRQAVQQFERQRALMPDNPFTLFQLSRLYLFIQTSPNNVSYAYPSPEQGCSNAVAIADHLVALTTNASAAPYLPSALLLAGTARLQAGQYEMALPPLTRLLALQTNYDAALFRAYANLKLDHLDDAKRDYELVATVAPRDVRVIYGLGDIAYRQKDNAAAIKYLESYLTIVPPQWKESEEFKLVTSRLQELKSIPK
jgi:tetratricopeptide (TPR) repeat protein